MPLAHRIDLTAPPPHSLVWQGDRLVDWASGGTRYHLDGTFHSSITPPWASFDAALSTLDGTYVVIYERLGTQGLLLRDGQILRELHRGDNHADAYEYPVALTRLADGRAIVAHCPDEYNILEFEDAMTGERLTSRVGPRSDFFHSRLRFSPGGRRLLSAGWVWHPWDSLAVYDVQDVLLHPTSLDQLPSIKSVLAYPEETRSADFLTDDTLVSAMDPESDGTARTLLSTFDLKRNAVTQALHIPAALGTIWALGSDVLALYGWPRLYDRQTGALLAQWPELKSGQQDSSIIHHLERPAPCAVDRQGMRFALGTQTGVTVIQLST
ncbi:hypothetical protein ACFFLM_24710 [Deinococcus oregonensis]|uniref:WD40 repeat domain-containing protein n=1 Tax=Deinococcus oregonensis TaxID=1805970 RepID=A0ABV6B5V9_9DEIO